MGAGLAKVSCFPYRQVGIVTVTMVHSSYDTGPPRPPVYVADFRRLVPADTEEPLSDQLRPSLDCHGPSAGQKTPPLKKLPNQRHPQSLVIFDIKPARWGESNVRKKIKKNENSLPTNGEKSQAGGFKCVASLHPLERQSLFLPA